jgi:hypothetical protein
LTQGAAIVRAAAEQIVDRVSPDVIVIVQDSNKAETRARLAGLWRNDRLGPADMAFIEEHCDPDTMGYLARIMSLATSASVRYFRERRSAASVQLFDFRWLARPASPRSVSTIHL